MLVPALAVDAELLQPSALLRAGDAVLVRQAVTQRAVGEAQPELLDHLRRLQAALDEILLRLRRLLQRLVIVAHHDFQQPLVVRRVLDQRRQFRHRAFVSAAGLRSVAAEGR